MQRRISSLTVHRIVALLAFALLAFACGDNIKPELPPDAGPDGHLSSTKELTAFSFAAADNPALAADVTTTISGTSIDAVVPFGTDVTALVATFTTTGASVRVAATDQQSGATANDFSSPVAYTVVAQDGSTQDYTVTVTVASVGTKAITSFRFDMLQNAQLAGDVVATITGTNIEATVPFGTNVSALIATFTTTGTSVTVGGTAQISGVTPNNFTNPVVYRVTAADSSTQDYTVTVTIGTASTAKAITAFSFRTSSNLALPANFDGTIDEAAGTIAIRVPTGTNRTTLIASFTHTGASIAVGSTPQVSGVTPNDFTNAVTYRVTAQDNSFKDYVVTVSEAAYCGSLAAPTGGAVTVTNQGFAPATATFTCEPGRALISPDGAMRSCDAPSNTWDPPGVPTCDPTVLVLRVGDGTNPLTNASTAAFLEERTISDGSVVQVIPVPTSDNGANKALTLAGTSNTEGALSTSADGRFVTFAGYSVGPGTASISGTTAAATPRVIGRIGTTATPTVDTSTTINDALSGTSIRAATTVDGTSFWAVGGNSGVRFVPFGGTGASTAISTGSPIVNLRSVHVAGGQLYMSTSSMTPGVHAIGTGTPTTTGQNATAIATTGTGASPHGFAFLDLDPAVPGVDTLYIGINEAVSLGISRINIQKWTFNGTAWTQNTLFLPSLSGQNVGVQGLTAFRVDGQTHILATTAASMAGNDNLLVHLVDNGVNLVPVASVFAQAGTNAGYRGVARSPYTP